MAGIYYDFTERLTADGLAERYKEIYCGDTFHYFYSLTEEELSDGDLELLIQALYRKNKKYLTLEGVREIIFTTEGDGEFVLDFFDENASWVEDENEEIAKKFREEAYHYFLQDLEVSEY